jgi:hypothetical protein
MWGVRNGVSISVVLTATPKLAARRALTGDHLEALLQVAPAIAGSKIGDACGERATGCGRFQPGAVGFQVPRTLRLKSVIRF